MKALLGLSGASLTLLYYLQKQESEEFRQEVKKFASETRITMEQIKSDVRLIDYRMKQIEKENEKP